MKGDLADDLRQGRPDDHPPAERRSRATPRRTAARCRCPAAACMLVRNVGHHMYTDAVLDAAGAQMPEGLLDAVVTIADRDARPEAAASCATAAPARSTSSSRRCTGRTRWPSPTRCSRASRTCSACRATRSRWASWTRSAAPRVNLKACIHAAQERVVFINTGFLDRTGDEIHTSMEAGPMIRKGDMQHRVDQGYEEQQRRYRPACGLRGRAQIGKGMWAAPDRMADMLAQKIGHPKAGANTAWVPSPTAATLHALHYHQVDVAERRRNWPARERATLADLLTIPLADRPNWSPDEIAPGTRQQLPGHPRLRGALDRPGRRLLEGARHPRRRPDGGPRDAAHLQPAHRQLAASRRRQPRSRCWRRCGAWRRWSTGRTPAIPPTGRWRRASTVRPSRRPAIWCSRACAAERLHRIHPARAPARGEGGRCLTRRIRSRLRAARADARRAGRSHRHRRRTARDARLPS